MRTLLIVLMVFVTSSIGADGLFTNNQLLISLPEAPKPIEVKVTATMYFADTLCCDADPLITAGMYHINPKKASKQRYVALSRNLLKRWNGAFSYGDKIRIKGAGKKDGIYKVVDTMNPKFTDRLDFLETAGTKIYKYNNVSITKV